METVQWPQQGVVKKVRPHKEQALNCPRCNSTNTKFCYYNNYSLSQPRYFCKSCRRYWTEGGSLRNVPVGGGSRKNKRLNSSSSSKITTLATTTSSTSLASYSTSMNLHHPPPKLIPHELSSFSFSSSVSALEPIRNGIASRKFLSFEAPNSSRENEFSANARIKLRKLMPFQSIMHRQEVHALSMPTMEGFGMQELMWPSMMKVPLDYGVGGMEEGKEGKLSFPFEDLRQVGIRNACDENVVEGGVDQTLFWEGVMGNGEGGGGRGW